MATELILNFFVAIIALYQWLTCYLLQKTYNRLENDLQQRKDLFWAKNDNQVFYAKNLSLAFIQVDNRLLYYCKI